MKRGRSNCHTVQCDNLNVNCLSEWVLTVLNGNIQLTGCNTPKLQNQVDKVLMATTIILYYDSPVRPVSRLCRRFGQRQWGGKLTTNCRCYQVAVRRTGYLYATNTCEEAFRAQSLYVTNVTDVLECDLLDVQTFPAMP